MRQDGKRSERPETKVVLVKSRPCPFEQIETWSKPEQFREGGPVQVEWGFGITPGIVKSVKKENEEKKQRMHKNRSLKYEKSIEKSVPMLAIAFEKVVQLLRVCNSSDAVEMDGEDVPEEFREENASSSKAKQERFICDGYFCAEEKISQMWFVGDSLLAVLVGDSSLKVLETKKF